MSTARGERPDSGKLPSGAKALRLFFATYGTTEVVPFHNWAADTFGWPLKVSSVMRHNIFASSSLFAYNAWHGLSTGDYI
jgi:hypothetical protein